MTKQKSLRRKAVNFVSDLTTVFLNPISDKSLPPPPPHPHPLHHEDVGESGSSSNQLKSREGEDNGEIVEGPDTSSFTAFLFSLLSSSESSDEQVGDNAAADAGHQTSEQLVKEASGGGPKRGLLSRGKQSLRAIYQAARIGGYRNQERKGDCDMKFSSDGSDSFDGLEMKYMHDSKEPDDALGILPPISEPSFLLSEKARGSLYASLPALVQGRTWLLLYSTWRHGISLATLYRRSMLWPGLSLLVVGDRKGAVFGGLVEAPLRPTRYK
ncbi:hypothetical protein Tsubulata_020855 [Turnera subulata]|uniref:Oxidation resistance protein 1 n=1 Tax=Turnera subulata TaxID=218843 RepID=A0A9Q0G7A6_9ROSI|nr:hypothetical protein Tsubulata_020855 [Turnera subulata]